MDSQLVALLEHAIEYRKLARATRNPKVKERWLDLAFKCEQLAAELERTEIQRTRKARAKVRRGGE